MDFNTIAEEIPLETTNSIDTRHTPDGLPDKLFVYRQAVHYPPASAGLMRLAKYFYWKAQEQKRRKLTL